MIMKERVMKQEDTVGFRILWIVMWLTTIFPKYISYIIYYISYLYPTHCLILIESFTGLQLYFSSSQIEFGIASLILP